MSIRFDPGAPVGKALIAFWKQLQDDNGARAELRRCKEVSDVMMIPIYHHFCQKIKDQMVDEKGWESRVAAIVGLMAHLKREVPSLVLEPSKGNEKSYAALFVIPMAEGDRPRVSELRFRRLLQRDMADLYPAMIRMLHMMDGNANLYGLAESIYYWGDRVKKDWAFSYFPRVPEKKSA